MMEHLKYPVGKYVFNPELAPELKKSWIDNMSNFGADIEKLIPLLRDHRMDTPYRPEGWTARQVIHHVTDSHMHAILRFKLALTEDNPIIKPYDEAPTANLSDYSMDVDSALSILKGVHLKWTNLLNKMTDAQYAKTYTHPQYGKVFTLLEALGLYDWHCRHHLGHLQICTQQ